MAKKKDHESPKVRKNHLRQTNSLVQLRIFFVFSYFRAFVIGFGINSAQA
jgi:phosphomevalonate kinase